MKKIILFMLIAFTFASVGCAGSRGNIKFEELKYPASLSPCMYGPDYKVLTVDKELTIVGKYKYSKIYFGFFYSALGISNDSAIVQNMNEEIEKAGADGIANVSVTVGDTFTNEIPFVTLIPVWPGAASVVVEGDLVKMQQ